MTRSGEDWNAAATVLDVRNLRVTLRTDDGPARVLDEVSLRVRRGEVRGVVGESGCGKSTLVKTLLGILPPSASVDAGSIEFEAEALLALDQKALSARIRGRRIGFIPQDPYLALNPVFTVGAQLLDLMRWHAPDGGASPGAQRRDRHRKRLMELLRAVHLPDAEQALQRYPHEFSGGQRQRILIAASLACEPALLIADEPTSALDVTTQQEILLLLKQLVREFDLSVLFVTHDFGVVAQLCDSVTVMYLGQTVESGAVATILSQPRHPYTRMLLACHPDRATSLEGIPGSVPSPIDPPSGCRFRTRCPSASPQCAVARPRETRSADGHCVHCVLYDDELPQVGDPNAGG